MAVLDDVVPCPPPSNRHLAASMHASSIGRHHLALSYLKNLKDTPQHRTINKMAPIAVSPRASPAVPPTKNGKIDGFGNEQVKFSSFDVTDQVFFRAADSSCFAIVNLKPIVPGHILVVPSAPYHRLSEVPADEVSSLFQSVQEISRGLEKVFEAEAVTIAVQDGAAAGQTVPHLHVHILPRKSGDIVPKDLVYEHLEQWGLDIRKLLKKVDKDEPKIWVDADEDRKPRSKEQMQKEATFLGSFFTAQGKFDATKLDSNSTQSIKRALDGAVGTRPKRSRTDRLPVTLLSGFLGAGKTTLLEHILTSKDHGLRVAVVVNDMGALNIDASLLSNHRVTQAEEKVVQMQNGCICCTLRGDLLEEVAALAENREIDYLLIESTGISEPMQVAETFSEEFADMYIQAADDLEEEIRADPAKKEEHEKVAAILKKGGLPAVSRLDTCVTVVDAVNLFNDYNTTDFLVDRHKNDHDVPEEDDRNFSDLQTDQLEFANVILINKCDLVSKEEVERIQAFIRLLNPDAKIIPTTRSRIDPKEILNTNLFSYEKAALGAGWLKSLNEEVKPETEEYGIGSFVYRARKPFHTKRLWETIREVFVVIQSEYIDDGEDGEEMDEDDAESEDEDMDVEEEPQPQLNPQARLEAKKASATFGPLLRSKGFVWLATRALMFGEWSQAGIMLTLQGGARWRCELDEELWPQDTEIVEAIKKDFRGQWGDRRQEIVLIGTSMRDGGEERLRAALDSCLLTDEEMKQWEGIMTDPKLKSLKKKEQALQEIFEDGFEDWPDHEDPEAHAGHSH